MQPLSLLSVLPDELAQDIPDLTLPEARRVLSLVHRSGKLPAVTPAGVRRGPFLRIAESYSVQHLELLTSQHSALDPFVKLALAAPDQAVIETVRIPLEKPGRYVVCVSSQVGCPMNCAFCATGKMGLRRHLAAWEIVEQVRFVREGLPKGSRVHGVVFQGMGEPLANIDAVLRTIRVLSDPSLLAIDARAITVCTSGLLRPLQQLMQAQPNVRLGISIGSALSQKRQRLIPAERSQPLAQVIQLLAEHAQRTRIAPMWAYTLLGGVNDSDEDVQALSELLQQFVAQSGVRPRLSLIPYNSIGPGDPFVPATAERSEQIRKTLGALGVPVVRRYSGGSDIAAACGQLGMALQPPGQPVQEPEPD